ncbi:MAG TPA: hypothetical protein PLO52_00385 [Flavobacterium alvei]|nr:hypothetical protein [Flavobacterium alvei]
MRLSKITFDEAKKEVACWQTGHQGSFCEAILSAYSKADSLNKVDLQYAYPNLTRAYDDWYYCKDSNAWIKSVLEMGDL